MRAANGHNHTKDGTGEVAEELGEPGAQPSMNGSLAERQAVFQGGIGTCGGAALRNTDNDPASSKAARFGGMHEGEVGTQFQEAGVRVDQSPQGQLLLYILIQNPDNSR